MAVAPDDLNDIWQELLADSPQLERRRRFDFDRGFYRRSTPELAGSGLRPRRHYLVHGRSSGRHGTRYQALRAEHPGIDEGLRAVVTDQRILAAMDAGDPAAFELAFELIQLGQPYDAQISNFSGAHYLDAYVDLARAGVAPLEHYLVDGVLEGRRTLADLRTSQYLGAQPYDLGRPTCLVISHELSRTGAPMVALQLAREAARTHNVIVASVRPGPLLDAMRETACAVVVTPTPDADFPHYEGPVFSKIDLAVCNSVESFPFIPMLVANDIPFAAYVHEYATYTFPAYKTVQTALFADLLVFSSQHVRDSWVPVLDDAEVDTSRDVMILPQRSASAGVVDPERLHRSRERLAALIGRDVEGKRIVCGAGFTDWRKGTDIFVMTAQIARHRDPDTIFVWVGDGLNPEDTRFGTWMAYHLDQVGAGDPEGNLFFLPAGDHYPDVIAASDAMLLSSRLDPLPNVVFDALESGCRVVLFEGATGFNDPTYLDSGHFHRVEYANPDAAASALLALPLKTCELASAPVAAPEPLFGRITSALDDRLVGRRRFVIGPTPLDVPVLFSTMECHRERRIRERERMFGLERRYLWRDALDAEASLAASENWVHRMCDVVPYEEEHQESLAAFGLHVHAFHVDGLAAEIDRQPLYRHARRIAITTDTDAKQKQIESVMGDRGLAADVLVVPNRGRDVLPFLELFRSGYAAPDETWCHLHEKRSAADGEVWRRFLTAILAGERGAVSSAATLIQRDDVGLVAALDPHFGQWNASRRLLETVQPKFEQPLPANPMVYPIGNMFWVRGQVVAAMCSLFGEDHAWSNEPLPEDGTEFHLIERLWPAVAASCGLRSVFVSKPDQPRRS